MALSELNSVLVPYGPRRFPLPDLVEDWGARVLKLVDDVSHRSDGAPWGIVDFAAALELRDVIDNALRNVEKHDVRIPNLELADWVFAAITEEISSTKLLDGATAANWWWHRILPTGTVADEYLALLHRRRIERNNLNPVFEALSLQGETVAALEDLRSLSRATAKILANSLFDDALDDNALYAIGETLALPGGETEWHQLTAAYALLSRRRHREGVSIPPAVGVAQAIAQHADYGNVSDLFPLLQNSKGPARSYLVSPIHQWGGPIGLKLLLSLVDDSDIGRVVRAELESPGW
jgi:hypothetical protein